MNEAKIIRTHKDTWCSIELGGYVFLLCIGAAGASDTSPSVVVVDTEARAIAVKTDNEIIDMIRETREVEDNVTDTDLIVDFARDEYM